MSAPAQYIPTIIVDNVCTALGAFLVPFLAAGTPVVRAYDNRVASPVSPYVELTELFSRLIETPTGEYNGTTLQAGVTSPTQIDVQIDFVGPSAGDQCKAVAAIIRSSYAAPAFPAGISPLYSDDGHNTTQVNAEEQYDYRWTLTASIQYNPCVYVPQQSATTLALNNLEVVP